MHVEGDVRPPCIPLHYYTIVRDGYRKGTFVGVVVTLVHCSAGIGSAADDAHRR